ncbi:hypothetical protein C0W52_00225 [Photobacterium kishitanii]|uniref:Toxin co-regulated pilus biosynthesis protein Q C-terminal domain-containing protein n=2 Tax=Photobacterium kishitanii TaxID=318456 RepID=A0AAX0YWY8_9GAMM|nr:TcpQ domain-containing protein [Photobacterium kishitanii]KJG65262.1 hypothetical protein UA40_12510 [Photobacterium kishitanii]PSX21533.1 hypothetical protein C0W70_01895 [Photobacterium kishitanii]PSX30460.1 hypothetical protein C0W52_00225 [Photobacterium kishitanii]PSX35890.1 hypothetical protein C0W39_01895 [Photobacterium kishitanii]PSX45525.1 hypothetical protein C0W53_09565 [Photobacterium kishitanii]
MNNESKGEAHIRKRSNLTTDTKSKSISLVVKDVNKNKEKPYSVLNNDSKVVGKIQKNSNTTLVKKVVKSKSIVENDISKKRVVKNSIKIIASPGESLKDTLAKTLSKSKYKLIWNSGYDVIFENYTEYKGDNAIDVVKKIASDIQSMGLDIHFNVYVKNNIILVFSVRN